MVATIGLLFKLAGRLTRDLKRLAEEATAMRSFQFDSGPRLRSLVQEVDDLSLTLDGMGRTIGHFLKISASLGAEQDVDALLAMLLKESIGASAASAGAHHETLDGRGYPRRLDGDQMGVLARVMAIADIFEALTAADRPYKRGLKLSEALAIMARMVQDQHIDGDLFELFLSSEVYLSYAHRPMVPAQIDAVDREALVASARGSATGAGRMTP